MHADDARHLYVDVAEPLRGRAAIEISSVESGQELSFRAQRPASPARTMPEAEGELERQLRSGYTTAVAFETRGEAERARQRPDGVDAAQLERVERPPTVRTAWSGAEPARRFCEARLVEGLVWPEPQLAVIPQSRLVHRRRAVAATAT